MYKYVPREGKNNCLHSLDTILPPYDKRLTPYMTVLRFCATKTNPMYDDSYSAMTNEELSNANTACKEHFIYKTVKDIGFLQDMRPYNSMYNTVKSDLLINLSRFAGILQMMINDAGNEHLMTFSFARLLSLRHYMENLLKPDDIREDNEEVVTATLSLT